ncbi:MAG: DUF86 domain-containing protein [Alicyclobacillaceae bacterium]|jgi:uncharacterized protein YutE (UPF0331/DUF86 family)|nr:DUF86 domain-containing protein [Alicyclobacillaceae bacterium]MCY0897071.1 DUF86 domain-containing protein [Alicyclobacillaceae bacterium]
MFITPAVRDKIEGHLRSLQDMSDWLDRLCRTDEAWEQEMTYRLAAERAIWRALESTTDICSEIIDALVMRDAGGYADMLKVLHEENVIDTDCYHRLSRLVPLRSRLLRQQDRVTSTEIREAVEEHRLDFESFMRQIRVFLGRVS